MKTCILVLILGIISVITSAEELNQKNPLPVNESQHNPIEDTTNVSRQDEQENLNTQSDISNEITEKYDNAEIDIVIEESIEGTQDFTPPEAPFEASVNELILPGVPTSLEGIPNELIAPEPATTVIYEDEVQEPQIFNPYIEDNVIIKEPGEIMETAAGFVPIPIIRNRQKQRRRFVTRRNFQRYPFRRFHFFYPYPFYHPSSLRYYRF
ncbi:uncharacterized protein LOC106710590 [Papilio machaon]|uniref:uncharacterized protein LOC106710590 n=1 Tax=Papilio machaon TaxID=76193 RepID=UPI001E663F06|nr:uncharacterized protein LOC106710590 [Papilio machaon]